MARGGSYAGRGGLPRPAHRGEYGKITQEPRRRGVTAATAACVARRVAQRSGMGGVLPPDRPPQGRREGPALGHLDQRPRARDRAPRARGSRLRDRPGDLQRLRSFPRTGDRKSTRLNSSHSQISYAVFCLKKKKKINTTAY